MNWRREPAVVAGGGSYERAWVVSGRQIVFGIEVARGVFLQSRLRRPAKAGRVVSETSNPSKRVLRKWRNGRRTILRGWRREAYGFKSRLPHSNDSMKSTALGLCFFFAARTG